MRLYHVSEESNIEIFYPRTPNRDDLDKNVGLVWAIDEKRLPNFLTPRDCPRVTYHIGKNTNEVDKKHFFTSSSIKHTVIIESDWFDRMKKTTLYLYEFDLSGFELQDEIAGYYISKTPQVPIAKYQISDLFSELMRRNVEIRIVDALWDIADKVKASTLNWSLCRMHNAKPNRKSD
ncbi:MAG: hypothetical protein IJ409_10950 [Lachnospiraceae bacterium]|nr:hypothetical protein [Lachnospiraceae bacterium]